MIFGTFEKQVGGPVPLVMRLSALLTVIIGVLLILMQLAVHSYTGPKNIELPSELLPGKQHFPSAANCEALHDGHFTCEVNLNGSTVELTYNAASQNIVYTSVATPDQTLGDLIMLWGRPTGLTHSGQSIVVFWNTQTAYLAPFSFRPETAVKFVAYGDTLKQTTIWRGFTSQTFQQESH